LERLESATKVVADSLSWLIATPTGLLERLKGATHQVFVAVFQSQIAIRYFLPFSSRHSPVAISCRLTSRKSPVANRCRFAIRCRYYEPLIEVPGL
jgi:hypothetical protein